MEKQSFRSFWNGAFPFGVMMLALRGGAVVLSRTNRANPYTLFLVFLVSVCAAVLSHRLCRRGLGKLPVPREKASVSLSVAHLFLTLAILIVLMKTVAAVLGDNGTDETQLTVFAVLSTVFLHPILEEYVFRRIFYFEFRAMNPVFAVLAQGILFALVHDTVGSMGYALLAGVVLGIVTENTNRLWVPIAAHAVINLRTLLYTSVFRLTAEVREWTDGILVLCGIVAAFFMIAVRVHTIRKNAHAEESA